METVTNGLDAHNRRANNAYNRLSNDPLSPVNRQKVVNTTYRGKQTVQSHMMSSGNVTVTASKIADLQLDTMSSHNNNNLLIFNFPTAADGSQLDPTQRSVT